MERKHYLRCDRLAFAFAFKNIGIAYASTAPPSASPLIFLHSTSCLNQARSFVVDRQRTRFTHYLQWARSHKFNVHLNFKLDTNKQTNNNKEEREIVRNRLIGYIT